MQYFAGRKQGRRVGDPTYPYARGGQPRAALGLVVNPRVSLMLTGWRGVLWSAEGWKTVRGRAYRGSTSSSKVCVVP